MIQQTLKPSLLLGLLYQNRELIDVLFGRKDSVPLTELLAEHQLDEYRIETLKERGILHDYNGFISLDDRLVIFFDNFLEIGEVHPEFIQSSLQELLDYIAFYHTSQRREYLRAIKQSLQRISSVTTREVIKLQKLIDDTYKNEDNFIIKKQKLEKYREKRDVIIELIRESEKIYEEHRGLLLTLDTELNNIVSFFRISLRKNRDFLNKIQDQIIEYINKIKYESELYKKIQRLKDLKDRLEINHKTDYKEILAGNNSLLFNATVRARIRTKVALDFLYTDEGRKLTHKVAEKLKLIRADIRGLAQKKSHTATLEKSEKEAKVDVPAFVQEFLAQKKDLLTFLLQYKFSTKLGVIDTEKRVSLFVEIALDYEESLRFSDEFQYFNYTDSYGTQRKVGYVTITART